MTIIEIMKPDDFLKLISSFALVIAAAVIGSVVTFPGIGTWYETLAKPFFNPPNWLFGPVWAILYILMAVALYLVWTKHASRDRNLGIVLFIAQLALNALWSIVFFGLQSTLLGVLVIVPLLALIIATTYMFYKVSKKAAYLMVLYILWVSFATVLNIAVYLLNF